MTDDAPLPGSPGSPAAERLDITALIEQAHGGNRQAADELFARVYADLHRLAKAQLGAHGRPGSTLDTTALVHETYLRLAKPAGVAAEGRAHFFNLAARVMRHVIVDFARRRDAECRGSGTPRLELASAREPSGEDARLSADILALDAALDDLERANSDLARLVELRFFAGLPLEEIGELVGRSDRSLKRDWRRARAFLAARLTATASAV